MKITRKMSSLHTHFVSQARLVPALAMQSLRLMEVVFVPPESSLHVALRMA